MEVSIESPNLAEKAMKSLGLIVGLLLAWASSTLAQAPESALMAGPLGSQSIDFAQSANLFGTGSYLPGALLAPAASPSSMAAGEPALPMPQGVKGVLPGSSWQVYAGYAFARFYAYPGTTLNDNGFDLSVDYYFKNWLGGEAELFATFGSLTGQRSDFLVGAGGAKLRWAASNGLEVWAHGLVGGAHFTPQTAYGNQRALAYEAGAGVDIPSRHRRLAYRVEGDMVGTRFFTTYQYSPKISAGIVWKF